MPGTCHFGCFYFRCRQDIPCESDAISVLAVFNKTFENGGKGKRRTDERSFQDSTEGMLEVYTPGRSEEMDRGSQA